MLAMPRCKTEHRDLWAYCFSCGSMHPIYGMFARYLTQGEKTCYNLETRKSDNLEGPYRINTKNFLKRCPEIRPWETLHMCAES